MNAKRLLSTFAPASLSLLLLAGDAHALSNLGQCRLDVADGALGMMKARHRLGRACLKDGTYCNGLPSSADDDLMLALTGVDSACVAAYVLDDVALEELAPVPCTPSWSNCALQFDEASSVQDSARCQRCMAQGRDIKLRFDLEVAPLSGASREQIRCASKLYAAMGRAAERGVEGAIDCAAAAGDPPWACSTAVVEDTAYERSLRRIERIAASCDEELAEDGSILGQLCHRPVTSVATLAACVKEATRCRVCQTANATLGLGQDCVEQSGDRLCHADLGATFGRPEPGDVLVANRGDGTVTMFDPYIDYRFGTLAASTFPVGGGPSDVIVHALLGLAYTANSTDGTVTFLDAATGQPAFGSLVSSTFEVGSAPSALALHSRGILYVANEGDGTVTFLDATKGSYLFGDLASSTFATGGGPAALAVDESLGILYVANSDDDTVTFLDALTGAPAMGNLAASTFPVGDEPRALFLPVEAPLLHVTNHGAGSVTTLDSLTGAPEYGTLAASTHSAGAGAIATTSAEPIVFTVAREGELLSAYTTFSFNTVEGVFTSGSVDLGGAASDVSFATWFYNQIYVSIESEDLLAMLPVDRPEAMLGYSAVENATVEVPGAYNGSLAVNPATGEYYLATYYGTGAFAAIDGVTREVETRGPAGSGSVIAYNPGANIVYVVDPYVDRVILLDATTGDYLSTSASICNSISGLTLAVSSGTLIARCSDTIVYLDAATGDFKTGALATSTLDLDGSGRDVVLDEANDRAYAEVTSNYPFETSIVAVTIASVGYANGTLAASKMVVGTLARGLEIDPVAGVLYRGYLSGEVKLYDTSGNLLGTSALPGGSELQDMHITRNPDNGLLYVSRSHADSAVAGMRIDDLVYLHASDGSFLHSSVDDSSVRLAPDEGVSKAAVNSASDSIAVMLYGTFSQGPTLLDPDEPLPLGEKSAYRVSQPTGDAPSAIAVVPSL